MVASRSTIAIAVLLPVAALAWHDTGHMVVAEIAYRHMSDRARMKANALLEIGGDAKTRSFLTASCWADDVKSDKDAPWHYINHFFRADGKPSRNKPLEQNLVWAIETMSTKLADRALPNSERADALRYLIHLVGDIHQPLHNVARETDDLTAGDRGGNDFPIAAPQGMEPRPRNLHFLWDMGGGVFQRLERPLSEEGLRAIRDLADRAMREFPRRSHSRAVAQLDPKVWSNEGFELAKAKVYALEEGSVPSEGYLRMCQDTSLRQVALAGYRLAGLLNSVLGD